MRLASLSLGMNRNDSRDLREHERRECQDSQQRFHCAFPWRRFPIATLFFEQIHAAGSVAFPTPRTGGGEGAARDRVLNSQIDHSYRSLSAEQSR